MSKNESSAILLLVLTCFKKHKEKNVLLTPRLSVILPTPNQSALHFYRRERNIGLDLSVRLFTSETPAVNHPKLQPPLQRQEKILLSVFSFR